LDERISRCEVVLEDVVRIQVPRGLIPYHLSRPAGASPPGFHPARPRTDLS